MGTVTELTVLTSLASRQHGLFARSQATELGIDRHRLRRHVRAGHLSFVTPRVLRISGSEPSSWQSTMAGVLDVGHDALASHNSAAALWGVPGVRSEPVHVSVVRVLRRRDPAAAVIHHMTVIPQDQRTTIHDIPVIAPPLTVLQICGLRGPHAGARALDHFLAARLVTVSEMWDVVDRMSRQGRNGLVDLRELLERRDDGEMPPQSNNERRFESLAWGAGLTTLKRQVTIRHASWTGRVDYNDTELPLVVEIHSERFHTSWAHRQADAKRIAALEAAGYTVVVVWDFEIWSEPDLAIERVVAARRRLLGRHKTFS